MWNSEDNQKGFHCELKPVVKKGMQDRGDSKTVQLVQSKNLTVSVWQDNKPMTVVATNSDPTVEEQVLRKQRDGSSTAVSCPQSIVLYNTNMRPQQSAERVLPCATQVLKVL